LQSREKLEQRKKTTKKKKLVSQAKQRDGYKMRQDDIRWKRAKAE